MSMHVSLEKGSACSVILSGGCEHPRTCSRCRRLRRLLNHDGLVQRASQPGADQRPDPVDPVVAPAPADERRPERPRRRTGRRRGCSRPGRSRWPAARSLPRRRRGSSGPPRWRTRRT
ncbi:hypothetical protein PVAP13_7NG335472 [Panicum virgatum]|uniref:Uncharacterized protein n=1 Tax=Panicum virgatum TaxID=38727 RepID=A0A8T0Q398_PANVG|nr:hypothetical protein PVAP13_7NG335472 [Panicum virgatum]